MNRRSIILGLGLAVALWLTFFGDKAPPDDISQPVVRAKPTVAGKDSGSSTVRAVSRATSPSNGANNGSSTATLTSSGNSGNSGSSTKNASSPIAILALQDRSDLLGQSAPKPESKPAPKSAKGIPPVQDLVKAEPLFDSQTWNPPPPPPPKPVPPPPPVAPPLPYLVLGKKLEDKTWEVYLARGDQTFIAREKGTLENQYRVDSIKPPTMTLTYLPLNQVQTLTIGGTD